MLQELNDGIANALAVAPGEPAAQMTGDAIDLLCEACSTAFGEPIDREIIARIAHYCANVGHQIDGRAAGQIEDIVIRYLFRYYASRVDVPAAFNVSHLEIGVLFGAGVIYAFQATRLAGKSIPIVAIDPFEGYYGASVDPVSKLEVTEERFRRNLALFDIPESAVDLIRGFSTDPVVYENCRSRKFVSLLIDGDHSYEGVRSDWDNFSPLVVPGGLVLLDDYNNPSWPEVTKCINLEILPKLGSQWATRLTFARSLLLQRTEPVD